MNQDLTQQVKEEVAKQLSQIKPTGKVKGEKFTPEMEALIMSKLAEMPKVYKGRDNEKGAVRYDERLSWLLIWKSVCFFTEEDEDINIFWQMRITK